MRCKTSLLLLGITAVLFMCAVDTLVTAQTESDDPEIMFEDGDYTSIYDEFPTNETVDITTDPPTNETTTRPPDNGSTDPTTHETSDEPPKTRVRDVTPDKVGKPCDLSVRVIRGRRLPGGPFDNADGYVVVTAINNNGKSTVLRTRTVDDTPNPNWRERLNFGVDCWIFIEVQVFDEEVLSDVELTDDVNEDNRRFPVQGVKDLRKQVVPTEGEGSVTLRYECDCIGH